MTVPLSKASNFLPGGVLSLASLTTFDPEQIRLGQYTFFPWVRTGLAVQLNEPAEPALRATVSATVVVEDDADGSKQVSKTLTLRGPSDVIGIDPAQVVRRYPEPNSFNAEETYLTHIEFDSPELPWLFSPFPPSSHLRPWIVLIVVEERFFSLEEGLSGLPRKVTTRMGELQSLDDSWAWAHAQILGSKDPGSPSIEDRLSAAYGATNLSRLLNPRKLEHDKSYVACVVPAFDCGVQAGLGHGNGTLKAAWERNAGDNDREITLPVYDFWRFRIASAGDFESLAKKLVGLPAPWPIGRRIVDFSRPRGGMEPLAAGEDGRVQIVNCALTSLAPPPADLAESAWTDDKRRELLSVVNAGDELGAVVSNPIDPLPRVSPRLYARFQRAESRVLALNDADWFPQLNSTPTHRVVAGIGTRVVQKNQELLMQAAWTQVGEIDKANDRLVLAQFARYTAESLHKKHLSTLELGPLSQVTRAVHGKVRAGGNGLTVFGSASLSSTAPAALTGAFRRATRLRGPLTRFFGVSGVKAIRSLVATGAKFQDFRRTYEEPDGLSGLSASGIAFYSASTIAKALNVAPAVAVATLKAAVAKNGGTPSVADQLLSPLSTWRIPVGSIDLGAIGADRLLDLVEVATPAKPSDSPSRAEALASILYGVSTSGLSAAASRATKLSAKLGIKLTPKPAPPAVVQAPVPLTGPLAGVAPHPKPIVPVAGFVTATTVSTFISAKINATGSVTNQRAAASYSQLISAIGAIQGPAEPGLSPLTLASSTLLTLLHPKTTITAHMVARLGKLPSWVPPDWFDDGFVQPIMQAPIINQPMYQALDDYDRQWLIPGLGKIRETDFATVLNSNPAFIETFLIGLSDEMGRELLWRGFPTDSRGTYFKRFWMADQDELSQPIHLFSHTPLASHIFQGGGTGSYLVLVVRGELIRRYPNAIMLAQEQSGTLKDPGSGVNVPQFAEPPQAGKPGSVLFQVPLKPDIILTGFLLSEGELQLAENQNHPWWFMISEHPTAPRFGLDMPAGASQQRLAPPFSPITVDRDAATWADFSPLRSDRFLDTSGRVVTVLEPKATPPDPAPTPPSTVWRASTLDGGQVARALLQDPFRAAFRALELIGPTIQS